MVSLLALGVNRIKHSKNNENRPHCKFIFNLVNCLRENEVNSTQFLTQVTSRDLVLTANRRLAHYMHQKYDALQLQQGKRAWPSLIVLPLYSWLETLWGYCNTSMRVLSDLQETFLWETVINESGAGSGLLNIKATASLVKDTWQLLNSWSLPVQMLYGSNSLDVDTFIGWCGVFQEKCQNLNVISRCEIANVLVKSIKVTATPTLPQTIYFIGFDDLTPAITSLQTVLRESAMVHNLNLIADPAEQIYRTHFLDQDQELCAMARWAYKELLHNDQIKVGCILSNLNEQRDKVAAIFEEIFIAQGYDKKFKNLPYNISAANSLGQYPIIQTALEIIKLNCNEAELDAFCNLIKSPFISSAIIEQNARTQLDLWLHARGEYKVSVNTLVFNCRSLFNACPKLYASLQELTSHTRQMIAQQNLENWANFFVKQLMIMGWPGDRSLNSDEFQIVERFKKIFDELVSVCPAEILFSYSDALNLLQQLIKQTLFQIQSDDTPIQILGMLETSGIYFDRVWVAGLDNESWPPSASPNPFIPVAIQQKYNMPHATPERELLFSQRITQRLINNADHVIFSHAQMDGDRPLSVSPLISNYPYKELTFSKYESIAEQLFASATLQEYSDEIGPPVMGELVSGGSGIIKAQAACPFQAFATYRLHAHALPEVQMGLAYHERGNLVHAVLAHIWNRIKSHEQLCSLSIKELKGLVSDQINKVFTQLCESKPFTMHERFLAIEKRRLLTLICDWLTIEKERPAFEVVSCEQIQVVKINQLELRIKIDRIDKLPNESHLIIDYKTGKTSIADWLADRPKDPQLPLYTLLCGMNICGLMFAQVRVGETGFQGITAAKDLIPGGKTADKLKIPQIQGWAELLHFWSQILQSLADEISAGIARVAPRESAACEYCQLQAVCRIKHH